MIKSSSKFLFIKKQTNVLIFTAVNFNDVKNRF